jgi:ribosomal 30S subunit maturation factor RimM
MPVMRRALVAAGLLALLVAPALARNKSSRKKGRVVRVERSRNSGHDMVRVCSNPAADGSATCYGRPPRPGEVGTVIDENGVRGTVRVQTVTAQMDTCQNESSWAITGTVQNGDLSAVTWQGTMLFDYTPTAMSHVIQNNNQIPVPSQRPSETLMTMVDNNSDDQPDLMITWYYCDMSGTALNYGQGQNAYCMVYYGRDGSKYEELRIDIVKNCY